MPIISAHRSDPGLNPDKQHNEDFIWVDEQAGLYILADGLGGHEAGDVASRLAANTIGPMVVNQLKGKTLSKTKIKEVVVTAIEAANQAVYKAAHRAGHTRKMGTTVVMALFQKSTVYISHAGDSRAYLLQGSTVTQLTEDDSWATFSGLKPTKDNSRKKIDHILTKSIGQESAVDPSFMEIKLKPGDHLLLCSDGLWGLVEDEQVIKELNKAGNNLEQAVQNLVDAANASGGDDNISIIALKLV